MIILHAVPFEMKIRIDILQLLHFKLAETPLNTPNRYQHISNDIASILQHTNGEFEYVDIDVGANDIPFFEPTPDIVLHMASILPKSTFPQERINDFSLGVILPSEKYCCDRPIRIDSRPANVKIYGLEGIRNTIYYHGNCRVCKMKHYYSYCENKDRFRRFKEQGSQKYFVISTGIGFTTKFLDRVSLDVSIGNTPFSKIASIYNNQFSLATTQELDPDILECNWLIYRLSGYVKDICWERNVSNSHLNTEKICLGVYEQLKNIVDSKWLKHTCMETGCARKMVVIDGNEKLYRYCCAKPFERVTGGKGEVNCVHRCVNNPVRGNKRKENSELCEFHLTGSPSPVYVSSNIDIRPITRNYAKMLEETITTNIGCKDEKNINKYERRTAGMFYIFRSCGIRLGHYEMISAESLSSVFTFLIDTFGTAPSIADIMGIIYDRACDLYPYIKRLADENNVAAIKFASLKYIVDVFHSEKHTQPKCTLAHPECKYHPDLAEFKEERNMNMNIAEQSFHLLNPYKHITRNMTYGKRLCLLKIIDDDYNSRLEKKLHLIQSDKQFIAV